MEMSGLLIVVAVWPKRAIMALNAVAVNVSGLR